MFPGSRTACDNCIGSSVWVCVFGPCRIFSRINCHFPQCCLLCVLGWGLCSTGTVRSGHTHLPLLEFVSQNNCCVLSAGHAQGSHTGEPLSKHGRRVKVNTQYALSSYKSASKMHTQPHKCGALAGVLSAERRLED